MPAKTPNVLLHGTLDAVILKTLTGGARHGYAIAGFIKDASADTVIVGKGSLYPASTGWSGAAGSRKVV